MSEVRCDVAGFSFQGTKRQKPGVSQSGSLLEALEKNPFPRSFLSSTEFNSLRYRKAVPIFLLAIRWVTPWVLETTCCPCHVASLCQVSDFLLCDQPEQMLRFILLLFILIFFFLGPCLQHMEVSRLGVEWELQLLAYTTATEMQDP